jgi:hypothetical protein
MPEVSVTRLIVMPFLVAVFNRAATASAEFTVGTSIRKAAPSGKRAAELGISNKSPDGIPIFFKYSRVASNMIIFSSF